MARHCGSAGSGGVGGHAWGHQGPPPRHQVLLSLLALLVQKYKYGVGGHAWGRQGPPSRHQVLSLLALLVQKYKY